MRDSLADGLRCASINLPGESGRHYGFPPVASTWYAAPMLKTRKKRLAARDARAVELVAEIERSIVGLENEDLLDLADIFRGKRDVGIGAIAAREMARRGISL